MMHFQSAHAEIYHRSLLMSTENGQKIKKFILLGSVKRICAGVYGDGSRAMR